MPRPREISEVSSTAGVEDLVDVEVEVGDHAGDNLDAFEDHDSPGVVFDAVAQNGQLETLVEWFQALSNLKETDLRQAIREQQELLREQGKVAVRAAASVGNLTILQLLQEECSLNPPLGGGAAVRAAAKGGHLEVLKWCKSQGLKPREGLRWAARTAAENGHLETLKWLWDNGLAEQFRAGGGVVRGAAQGAQLEVLNWVESAGLCIAEGGAWSMRLAAQTGNLEVVRWLFEHGMTPSEHGASALRGAAACGHLEMLRWVARQAGAPNVSSLGRVLVWAACEGGHLPVLLWLKEQGVQMELGGGAAVWAAARGGHLAILQWLDAHGLPASKGGTPVVRAAVKGGYLDMLQWLALNGLDVSDGGSFCGPGTAAEKGHLEVLEWLVDRGMQLEKVGDKLTVGAARGGQMGVLQWLRVKGVDVYLFSQRVVQEAAAGGHLEVLNWLLLNEVKISHGGWEAVQAASVGGFLEILQWMLGHGLSVKDHARAAITGAAKGGHLYILQWLLQEGVELERHCGSAVQEAAAYGHVHVLRWLQAQGLQVDEGGRKAICRAAEGGHLEALQWLIHEGGIDLRLHWRAAVWVAGEAAQPDVHHWLLQEERPAHYEHGDLHAARSHKLTIPTKEDTASASPGPHAVFSPKLTRMSNLPSVTTNHSDDPTGFPGQGSQGLKWMLQYTLDSSEGIFDSLTVSATEGHMETLDWISTIAEPHWTVKIAIKNGHLSCLQWIVSNGLDLKSVEDRSLRWAAEAGRTDVLKWLKNMGAKLSVVTIEAAASRGKSTALELLRQFELPLSQHPSMAEDLLPYFSNVNATLLANFILVPCPAAEEALNRVLMETRVTDHKGRALKRAALRDDLSAATFCHKPDFWDLQQTIAPHSRAYTQLPSQDVPVKIFHIPVPGATSPVILRALAVTPRLQVYDTLAAQGIVLAAWGRVRRVYICDVLLDLVQLMSVALITAQMKPYEDTVEHYQRSFDSETDGGAYVQLCVALLVIIWIKAGCGTILRYRAYSQRGWGWDLATLTEAWEGLCFFVMGLFLITMLAGTSASVACPLLSVVGFTRWWKVLYSLRGFDYFGRRILPILGAFREILPFSLVMVCYGGALAHAFYALSHHPLTEVAPSFYRLGIVGEVDETDSLWGTGESAASVGWLVLQQAWFVVASFLFTVALMNIFIAIMSSAFDRKEERADEDFLRTRADLCLGYALSYEVAAWLTWRIKRCFIQVQSPVQAFSPEDETVWICHVELRTNLDTARSVRQMVSCASEQLLSETDARLKAHEKTINTVAAQMKESLRQHRAQMRLDLMNAGIAVAPTDSEINRSWTHSRQISGELVGRHQTLRTAGQSTSNNLSEVTIPEGRKMPSSQNSQFW